MENKLKERFINTPLENHETAAWANFKSLKPVSKVGIPDEISVRNAKEYVDTNEK